MIETLHASISSQQNLQEFADVKEEARKSGAVKIEDSTSELLLYRIITNQASKPIEGDGSEILQEIEAIELLGSFEAADVRPNNIEIFREQVKRAM